MKKKQKTKKEYLAEQIAIRHEDIWRMELVRDFNKTKGTPNAEVEANAAEKRIKEIEIELTFLNEYHRTCQD